MPKRARVTLETVRRLALAFPGVEEGLSYGTPGFRVRGRFLARLPQLTSSGNEVQAERLSYG
jgi:hypothetical protein